MRNKIRELNEELTAKVAERTRALMQQTTVLAQQGALLEFAHDAVILNDIDGRILSWSRGAEIMYGWPAEQAVGKVALELLKTESTFGIEEIRAELLEHDYWEGEFVQYTRAGARLYVSTRMAMQRGLDGTPLQLLTLNDDVTASKRDAEKLNESIREAEQALMYLAEQKYALDQHAIVAQTDVQGTITAVNDKFCAISKYSRDELLGQNHRLLNSGHHSKQFFQDLYDTITKGKVWRGEIENRAKDGSSYWADATIVPFLGANGNPRHYVAIHADITDRKKAQLEVASLVERLSLATAIAKVGVWEWDVVRNTLTWDATMFEMYGIPCSGAMPLQRWSAAVHHDDLVKAEAMLREVTANKCQNSGEFRITRSGGAIRHISSAQRVILDADQRVTRVIGVNLDVTDRKETEQLQEQSNKDQLRFKDQFLSHVSHELRSPLTAITQFTNILLGGIAGQLNSEQREYQQIVLRNARQLQSMIDDLLDVTRLESGKIRIEPERVSVPEAIADAVTTLRGPALAKGVTVSFEHLPNLPTAYADPTRLRQAFIILLDNAIKFTPPGGAVTITVKPHERDPKFLLIEVSDTGCGIDPAIEERIFERLYQVSESDESCRKGLGLGLYICKELINQQGGLIWTRSELGKGSVFSFTLPAFSLNNLIAPLLNNDKWPAKSLALVVVEMRAKDGRGPGDSVRQWSREARNLVQRCLLPNLDVLLPKMSPATERERFFVVAFADEKGAAILTNRIREQFERNPRLKEAGQTLCISHTMLEPFPVEDDGSMENMVTRMATNLEQSIKSQIALEVN